MKTEGERGDRGLRSIVSAAEHASPLNREAPGGGNEAEPARLSAHAVAMEEEAQRAHPPLPEQQMLSGASGAPRTNDEEPTRASAAAGGMGQKSTTGEIVETPVGFAPSILGGAPSYGLRPVYAP